MIFFSPLKKIVNFIFTSRIKIAINAFIFFVFLLFGDLFSYKLIVYLSLLLFLNLVTYMYLRNELYPLYIMARYVPDETKDIVNTGLGGALYLAWLVAIIFGMVSFIS